MPSSSPIINVPVLLLLIVANSTPVVMAQLLGTWRNSPIDAGIKLCDGRPLFGPHKTWRGFISGTAAAGLFGTLLPTGFVISASGGLLALTGDLLSSFLKRRMNRASGQSTPLVDQLPEALLPMLVFQNALVLPASSIAATAVIFSLLDMFAAKCISWIRGGEPRD
jgi:CDP-2,3-bis-(O-geranylgeranyl)-sn-glycerol synthase